MKIITLLFLMSGIFSSVNAMTFAELLGKIESEKAQRAVMALRKEEKPKNFHIDYYYRHFLMSEEDQVVHIIYILANEQVIDGEMSFCVTRMFAYREPGKGKYDVNLAKNRFQKIAEFPEDQIKEFISYVGGDIAFFKKNLAQFKDSLKISE